MANARRARDDSAAALTGLDVRDPAEWNAHIATLPHCHVLQSWEWGEFKARHGWRARRWWWEAGAAAQILTRAARGIKVMYVPKGPLLDWGDPALRARVLDNLQGLARREGAVFIKVDPDLALARGHPEAEQPDPIGAAICAALGARAWRPSRDQIQFRNTVLVDLRQTEADLLARMKQKTRYNVRLAERRGVRVRPGTSEDLDLLYRMYAETSVRDGFVIRAPDYYRDAWGAFMRAGLAHAFVAEVGDEPVSSLILFTFARTAWYMYGMSRYVHREKMSNYLLQWEAMSWAKSAGCHTYDFWGAPDEFVEADPMWGVWKFKEGFGGQLVRHIGGWDYAPSLLRYRLLTSLLPRVLDLMRRRGRRQTREALA